jgi:hypothetical protein
MRLNLNLSQKENPNTKSMERTKKPAATEVKQEPVVIETVAQVTRKRRKLSPANEEIAKKLQEVNQEFIKNVPLAPKRPQQKRIRVPHTEEGGIDWKKFLPEVLTARPEGMPYDVYKQALRDQKMKLKLRGRV